MKREQCNRKFPTQTQNDRFSPGAHLIYSNLTRKGQFLIPKKDQPTPQSAPTFICAAWVQLIALVSDTFLVPSCHHHLLRASPKFPTQRSRSLHPMCVLPELPCRAAGTTGTTGATGATVLWPSSLCQQTSSPPPGVTTGWGFDSPGVTFSATEQ